MSKDDPCVGVCQWYGRTGWCLGCGRTVPEIKAWRKSSPFRRTALLRELPRRLAQLGKGVTFDPARYRKPEIPIAFRSKPAEAGL